MLILLNDVLNILPRFSGLGSRKTEPAARLEWRKSANLRVRPGTAGSPQVTINMLEQSGQIARDLKY